MKQDFKMIFDKIEQLKSSIKTQLPKQLENKFWLKQALLGAVILLAVVLLIVFIITSNRADNPSEISANQHKEQAQIDSSSNNEQPNNEESSGQDALIAQSHANDENTFDTHFDTNLNTNIDSLQNPPHNQHNSQDFVAQNMPQHNQPSQIPQALQTPTQSQNPRHTPANQNQNLTQNPNQNPPNTQKNYPQNLPTAKDLQQQNAKYTEVKITPSQAQGLGIKDIPIQNPSITRGVPFNALIDFDDKESATQSSTFDVVVVAIYMREGETINEGDEICEINSNELNNSYFELENARNRYRVAQEVAQKDKGLYESGVISQREYQTSYLASRELFLKLSQLENSFKLFGIDPKRPKGKSGFRVVASSSGILSVAPKTTGEKIPAFTPYVRISKSNDLLARIKIPASISDYVVPGSKVYSEQGQYVGDISTVSVVLDKTNNSITAIARLQKGVFRVGEVADIYIEGKQPKGTVALPSDAVIKNGKDDLIFIKTKDGYMPRVVNIVEKRSKSFVIDSSGLRGSEQVASGALIALKGIINNVGEVSQ